MNADNGSAIFGKGQGKIIIDPSQNDEYGAVLFSSNYYSSDRYGEDGLPNSYGNSNTGAGMMINLSKPYIKFGSGNFEVNSNGHLTAKGGGSIAGWQIGDSVLTGGSTTLNKNGTITVSNLIAKTSGRIANFNFDSSHLGYNGKDDFETKGQSGIYIGEDGISMGLTSKVDEKLSTPFKVDVNGNLTAINADLTGRVVATSGYIGGWLVHGEYNPRYDAWSGSISSGPVSLSAGVSDSSGGIYGSISAPRIGIVEDDFSYIPTEDCLGMFEGNNEQHENVLGIFSINHSIVLETNRSGAKHIRLTSAGRRYISWCSKRGSSSK